MEGPKDNNALSDPVATPVSLPSHDTATCSGWKTRGMLNVTEAPGRGYQEPKQHGGEGWTYWGLGYCCFHPHQHPGGTFWGAKLPPQEPLWVSHPDRASQHNLGPPCSARALPRGPTITITRHLPPSPPSATKSTGALREN